MPAWLGVQMLGLPRWLWGVLALAVLAAVILWAIGSAVDQAEKRGAVTQRESDLREVIDRVEKSNEIRETVGRSNGAAYDECLQSARTPANCIGLLPDREGD